MSGEFCPLTGELGGNFFLPPNSGISSSHPHIPESDPSYSERSNSVACRSLIVFASDSIVWD